MTAAFFFVAVVVFPLCLVVTVVTAGLVQLFGRKVLWLLAAAAAETALVMWLARGDLGVH